MISRVKGTEDILDLQLHNTVLDWAKNHLINHNFSEISTPILEPVGLFKRSLGLETDVVTKEMYTLKTASGEELCLRPEATASSTRAFLNAGIKSLPWKVFSYGPMFRHERPQKGRWRQFNQINIESIGSHTIMQDVQFLLMLDRFFSQKLLLSDYVLKINFLGSVDDRARYKEKLGLFLDEHSSEICETCQVRREKNILRTLDCKNETCKALYRNAPTITDSLEGETAHQWHTLQEQLSLLSVSFVHDPYLVRGLDYYNNTVFEFSSPLLGAQSAFCGGGRYDGLASQLGAKNMVPAIGASIGMGRLLMLIAQSQDELTFPEQKPLSVIIPMDQAQQTLALMLSDKLQAQDSATEVLLEGASLKSMMRKADKLGATWTLIIGEDEMRDGTVSLKNMHTGEKSTVKQIDVAALVAVKPLPS